MVTYLDRADVAIAAAPVTLISGDLRGLPRVISLSRSIRYSDGGNCKYTPSEAATAAKSATSRSISRRLNLNGGDSGVSGSSMVLF